MKKIGILFATVVMMLLFAFSASAATEGYYTYEIENGEVVITDVDTSISGDVVVPSEFGGYNVTYIGDYAFDDCTKITSVIIPDSVKTIGFSAFYYCTNLKTVTIPDSVTYIGTEAFRSCSSIISITLPDSVIGMGSEVFFNCYNLESIELSKNLTIIPDGSFSSCTNLTNITIPDSVISIGFQAFYDCDNLTDIILPDSITNVDACAFANCDNLKNIKLSNNMSSLEGALFSDCRSLESVIIPDSVTKIEEHVFFFCDSLKEINIPANVTSIASTAFGGCGLLENISVDENNYHFMTDEYGVLYDTNKTTLIRFPSAKFIESYRVPDSVMRIESHSFSRAFILKNLIIPNSVCYIGSLAFEDCSNLESIIIPKNVVIDEGVFLSNTNLIHICFGGTEEEWKELYIYEDSEEITSPEICHFNFDYEKDVVDTGCSPTCQNEGYIKPICSCGYTYAEEVLSKTECSFTNYIHKNATCLEDGSDTAFCDYGCGSFDTITHKGSAYGHSFINYVFDENSSCTEDGTKTAECDNGCGNTKTVVDEGSKLPHTDIDTDNICDMCGTEINLLCELCGEIEHENLLETVVCLLKRFVLFVIDFLAIF